MSPESAFNFFLNTRVTFGSGTRKDLPAILKGQHWKNVGVVADHNLSSLDTIQLLVEDLRKASDRVTVGWCRISEPTYDSLEEVRGQFEDPELQVIVGVGGGSALDMAKAMAVLVHNRQPAIHYRGFDRMTEKVLPVIAVPTTAGTGSEVTPNASFIDTKEKRKMGINGEAIRPRFAILDPELTLSCPERPTVSAGVDSIVHATEAYVAKKTNPPARLLAREGFRHVFNTLPRVIASPDDVNLRAVVMYGAFLSGLALMNSGTGPAAAMSYPLGVHYGIPHGIGGATFLPHVARYNVEHRVYDYADLNQVMEGADCSLPVEHQARQFVERMLQVWRTLKIANDVSSLGIDVKAFVADTLKLGGALDQNPVRFGEQEVRAVLKDLSADETPL